ncbi:MAG: hypothetical protein M3R58_08935 [Pseudomonadota bacterium]|nr:hypothetical protein [Pseudomonadota bacterium]
MIRVARLAPFAFAAVLPCQAADFPNIGDLAQGEFRAISRDLGAAFAYKGVTPATALGPLGFDVGVEVTETRMENSTLFARAGAGGQSRLLIPKVHVHKGLFAGFDIGAFAAGAPDIAARLYGAELRYAIVDDGLTLPAIGVRVSGTRASGLGELEVSTAAVDLIASKRFTALTPYVGAGTVRVQSAANGTGLARETLNQARVFGGLNVNLLAVNLAFEAEKMGDNVSLSAKVGWRF